MADYIYRRKYADADCDDLSHKISQTTNLHHIKDNDVIAPRFVEILNIESVIIDTLSSPEELGEWCDVQARNFQWADADVRLGDIRVDLDVPRIQVAVDPKHYKSFIKDMQWIETQQYRSRDFFAGIKMLLEKYLDRCGKKDDTLQELLKTKWYLDFLIAYLINGEPIKVENVETIIAKYFEER